MEHAMGRKFLLMAAFLLLGGIVVQSCGMVPSTVTAYTALCQGTLSDGNCDGTVIPWRKIVFRISPGEQDITFMVFGSWKKPVHLKNCMVVDKHNWFGEHPDGVHREMMIKGTLVEVVVCQGETGRHGIRFSCGEKGGPHDARCRTYRLRYIGKTGHCVRVL